MSPFAVLDQVRVGCVQYLNAKPLIAPYDGPVVFKHPGRLADMLAAGEIDVALVPAFEALRQPGFPIVDGAAISSRGAVYSVFLAYRGELSEVRTVHLDPVSRTSNNLLRCLLGEFHGLEPRYETAGRSAEKELAEGEAMLLIGNHAIRFRSREREGIRYLDLGEEWQRQTGLPFAYAVWQIRPEVAEPEAVAAALRAVKCAGVRRAREIGREQTCFDAAFGERYLTEYIKFDLGEEEKRGLLRFRELLEKEGLLAGGDVPLRFV